MRVVRLVLAVFALGAAGPLRALPTLTHVADLTREAAVQWRRFDLSVQVVSPPPGKHNSFIARDATGIRTFHFSLPLRDHGPWSAGDLLRIAGEFRLYTDNKAIAICDDIQRTGHATVEPPETITDDRLGDDAQLDAWRRIRGTVRGVFADDIDPDYAFLVLGGRTRAVYVNVCIAGSDLDALHALLGTEVTVDGFICAPQGIQRFRSGRQVFVNNVCDIRPLREAGHSAFDAPALKDLSFREPAELLACGRRRARGSVLAVWGEDSILLGTDEGTVLRADLVNVRAPRTGERIEVSGFPETDFFRINLSCATWRPAPSAVSAAATNIPPDEVSIPDLFADVAGRSRVRSDLQGRTVRLNGRVCDLLTDRPRLLLKDGDFTVSVDAHALGGFPPDVSVGCELAVSGVCVIDTGNWRSPLDFPRINDVLVCVRDASDVRILRRPSRGTPQRLLLIIGSLLAILLAVLVWNRALHRLVAKRSRQLADETLAHAESSLRLGERTRLAVELHDSVAQTLSGISLELDAASGFLEKDPSRLRRHLTVAVQSLKSCRDEIRNCIWDLRTRALELDNTAEAIRQTLLPHLGDARLAVRFNVPRARLTDNTMHAILRIVRELAVNAVRHGHASLVQVAGSIEGDRLLFSVHDNGSGFDPAHAPGLREGHFGLQGVRERIEGLEGEMTVDSAPGKGAKITLSLKIPKEETT